MTYWVTTAILLLTVAGFFLWARRGVSPFGWMQWVLRIVVALPLLVSGVGHFSRTALFAAIVPTFFPYRPQLVLLSGAMEIAGAIGLFLPIFSRASSACLVILMIAIFPANVYVANQTVGGMHMPSVPVRLGMQLIYIVMLLLTGWGLPRRSPPVS